MNSTPTGDLTPLGMNRGDAMSCGMGEGFVSLACNLLPHGRLMQLLHRELGLARIIQLATKGARVPYYKARSIVLLTLVKLLIVDQDAIPTSEALEKFVAQAACEEPPLGTGDPWHPDLGYPALPDPLQCRCCCRAPGKALYLQQWTDPKKDPLWLCWPCTVKVPGGRFTTYTLADHAVGKPRADAVGIA
jgi:hypothetical protein